jgi:hypothetical protein
MVRIALFASLYGGVRGALKVDQSYARHKWNDRMPQYGGYLIGRAGSWPVSWPTILAGAMRGKRLFSAIGKQSDIVAKWLFIESFTVGFRLGHRRDRGGRVRRWRRSDFATSSLHDRLLDLVGRLSGARRAGRADLLPALIVD